jgi:quercetin dioxygenase-like cupin family protein
MFKKVDEVAERTLLPGFRARFIHTENLTLAYWNIDEGAALPEHSHPHEQVANVLEGKLEMTVGDETKVLEPGVIALIPPNVKHYGKALTNCKVLDIFYPVREDYK